MLSIRCCRYSVQVAEYYLHNFQHLRFYSTNSSNQIPKSPNQSYINYLVDNLGFSHQQAQSIYTKLPYKFADAHFSKLGFLMTELGYKPDFLATHSVLLGCSLEKRLSPRHRVLLVLKEKGLLDYNFYTATIKSEKQFLKILIEPFKKDAPGLLELYQSGKGYSSIDPISRHQQCS